MHSVLFLILAFFNAAGLFVLLGAEFLAMLLVVVYVGAVAVLFLFVVMMLDVDFAELREGFIAIPAGRRCWSAASCWSSCCVVVGGWRDQSPQPARRSRAVPIPADVTNTEALGRVLYTNYVYYFQAAGLVLLVAMIGAIVLTLRHKAERQAAGHRDQSARTPDGHAQCARSRRGRDQDADAAEWVQ